MKLSPIRRLRLTLNALALILATLGIQQGYFSWKKKDDLRKIITLCQIPPPPSGHSIHQTHYEETKDGPIFISFSISAPVSEMDAWLDQMDSWENTRPHAILTVMIRESQSASRVDFSAEYLREPSTTEHLISQTRGTLSPPVSK